MNCELRTNDIQDILATIAEHAKLETRLRLTIERDALGYRMEMHSFDNNEPEVAALVTS